jgi:hypothetical protein
MYDQSSGQIEATLWTTDFFDLGNTTAETLASKVRQFDFGIFVITADDTLIRDPDEYSVPRDNVLFELGMFIGYLGRSRSIILYDADAKPKLPSDLDGVTRQQFYLRRNAFDMVAALRTPVSSILQSITTQGKLDSSADNISKIHPTFPLALFQDKLTTARQVNILQTWAPIHFYPTVFRPAVIKNNNTEINVLLLAPGDIAEQRARDQGHKNGKQWSKSQIDTTMNHLDELRQAGCNVNVKMYDMLPSLAIYCCDDTAFVGFYVKNSPAIDKPFQEIRLDKEAVWRKLIEEEFKNVAANAKSPSDYGFAGWA